MITNKKIAITGTTRGIGRCLLNRLSKENLCYEYNRPEFDLENIESLKNISFSDIDILILNAGSMYAGKGLFSNHSLEDWPKIIYSNLVGNLVLMQNYINQRDQGLIVVLSSMRAAKFTGDAMVYSVAKTGLSMAINNLRIELDQQKKSIRLLDVKPSFTKANNHPDYAGRKVSTFDQVADGIIAAMINPQLEEIRF